MADEEKKEETEGESAAKQPIMSKVGLIAVVVFIVIYTGILVFVLKPDAPPEGKDAAVETIPKVDVTGTIINIEAVPVTVIVNETTQESKMINVEMSIELGLGSSEDIVAIITKLKPWIKSKIITVVQSRGFSELMKPEAKDYIKNKMKSEIENKFKQAGHMDVKIKDVLITSFIIAG